jgi:hypothetical protein
MKQMYQLGKHRAIDSKPFLDSDYLLPLDYVDQFKDEVASRRGPAVPDRDGDKDDGQDSLEPSEGMLRKGCTTNFKAAAEEERKRMWGFLWRRVTS